MDSEPQREASCSSSSPSFRLHSRSKIKQIHWISQKDPVDGFQSQVFLHYLIRGWCHVWQYNYVSHTCLQALWSLSMLVSSAFHFPRCALAQRVMCECFKFCHLFGTLSDLPMNVVPPRCWYFKLAFLQVWLFRLAIASSICWVLERARRQKPEG